MKSNLPNEDIYDEKNVLQPFCGCATKPFLKQVLNNPFAPMEGHSSKQHNYVPQQQNHFHGTNVLGLIFKDNTFALGKGHSASQSNTTIS